MLTKEQLKAINDARASIGAAPITAGELANKDLPVPLTKPSAGAAPTVTSYSSSNTTPTVGTTKSNLGVDMSVFDAAGSGLIAPILPDRTPAPAGNLVAFSNALESAVEIARAKRELYQNEFLAGKVKPGSVSATTFSGVLRNIALGSRKFSERLADGALDAAETEAQLAQREHEQKRAEELILFQNKMQRYEKDRATIQGIGMALINAGVKTEIVDAAMKAGSVEAAMQIANGHLTKYNQQIVTNSKTGQAELITMDKDGNIINRQTVFGSSTSGGGLTTGEDAYNNMLKFIEANPHLGRNELEHEFRKMRDDGLISKDITDGDITSFLDAEGINFTTLNDLTDEEMQGIAKARIDKFDGLVTTKKIAKARAVEDIRNNPIIIDDKSGKKYILSEEQIEQIITHIEKDTWFGMDHWGPSYQPKSN